uniref:C-type lectin domain-containing protein n=1 Tax=Sphenodon punctatus TaxID=8508 RepID=A0A8D0H1Y6_SPHPU
ELRYSQLLTRALQFNVSLSDICAPQPQSPSESYNASCSLCPASWVPNRGSCYNFSVDVASWNNSRAKCLTNQADLVIINNRQEQEFLTSQKPVHLNYWIGMTDIAVEGSWKWVDGSPLDE